jgi:asparagine synthase (glutamine-hydrolysing)
MFRYVGLIWAAQDAQQVDAAQAATRRLKASASQWQEVLDRPGLRVFCADIRPGSLEPHVLPGKAGIVLGALFARRVDLDDDTPAQTCQVDDARSARSWTAAANGSCVMPGATTSRSLPTAERQTLVLKDPCGSLPCFSTTCRGITVVFSSIPDCMELGSVRFTVNRRFVERRLYGGEMTQQFDALNEITQIRRGECLEFAPLQQPALVGRRFLWNPFDFVRSARRWTIRRRRPRHCATLCAHVPRRLCVVSRKPAAAASRAGSTRRSCFPACKAPASSAIACVHPIHPERSDGPATLGAYGDRRFRL